LAKTSTSWRGALSWALVLAGGWAALAALGYRARDPDSRLYAEMSARMAEGPAAGWIAPPCPPGWYMSGPYREHPVGLFVPAAALAALGYPGGQAAYAMNAAYQVLAIVLLGRLAALLAPGLPSQALRWLIQLLPIAFTFRIRANQEAALLLCLVVAVYGTARSRERSWFSLLTVAGLVGLLLVKGVLAVFGPALCGLWLIARRLSGGERDGEGRAWAGIGAGVLAMAVTAAVYEVLYRKATGQPFWSFYLSRQLGVAAAADDGWGPVAGFAYTSVWYLARVLWFAFPWSLVALVAWRRGRSAAPRDAGRAGTVFVIAVVALYVALFSLSSRRADRYIFPAYYALGASGFVASLGGTSSWTRLVERLDRPWTPAAAWAILFAAHLAAGPLGLPTIKIWSG
jgi:hypothetical protein